MIYIFIFMAKVIEISLGTLRMIVVSNGKKWLGAFLQLGHALVWVFSTGAVLIGINKDWLKIVAFATGSFVGSYVGCFIEEKLAIGSNMIICITDLENEDMLQDLRKSGFAVTVMKGCGMEKDKEIYMIVTPRKKRRRVVSILKKHDNSCMIISSSTIPVSGGHIS